MSTSEPPSHWLHQTVSEFINNLTVDRRRTDPEIAWKSLQITFGVHIWQKGIQDHAVTLFTNARGELDIPGEHFNDISEGQESDLTIQEIILQLLQGPIQSRQICDVQFLDALGQGYFISNEYFWAETGKHHVHIPIMLSADVTLHGGSMTIRYLNYAASTLHDPKTFTESEMDELRERTQPYVYYEEMSRLYQRRKALTRTVLKERCDADNEVKNNILKQALDSLFEVKRNDPLANALFRESGRALAVVNRQEDDGEGLVFFVGGENSPTQWNRSRTLEYANENYDVLMSWEWDDLETSNFVREGRMSRAMLEGVFERDGRLRVAGWHSVSEGSESEEEEHDGDEEMGETAELSVGELGENLFGTFEAVGSDEEAESSGFEVADRDDGNSEEVVGMDGMEDGGFAEEFTPEDVGKSSFGRR